VNREIVTGRQTKSAFSVFQETRKSCYTKGQLPDQGCQIFLGTTNQNGKYIPNDQQIYQKATKYPEWPRNRPDTPKFTQVRIFGFKIYHLATLFLIRTGKEGQDWPIFFFLETIGFSTIPFHCEICKQ
jgi:hypothetical protein